MQYKTTYLSSLFQLCFYSPQSILNVVFQNISWTYTLHHYFSYFHLQTVNYNVIRTGVITSVLLINFNFRLSDIKKDVHNYFYNYNLSFVDGYGDGPYMMESRNDVDVDTLALDDVSFLDPGYPNYDKETVTNLMIIGAGGIYLGKL